MINKEFKPHASKCTSNFGGIEIMINDSCDGLYYRHSYGQEIDENKEVKESEILFNENDEPYFLDGENEEYLNEYIKLINR